jgi:hypothetical protein
MVVCPHCQVTLPMSVDFTAHARACRAIRRTATTIECGICGNKDPERFATVTGGFVRTRFQGRRAEESGSIVLSGARCLICEERRVIHT